MRLAFITSLLPQGRPTTGFEIATGAILDWLRAAGVDVRCFGFLRPGDAGPPEAGQHLIDRVPIENAEVGLQQKLRWIAGAFRLGLPVISAKLAMADGGRLARLMADAGPFDGVIINSAPVAGAFPWLTDKHPSIIVAHNVEHQSAASNARSTAGLTALLYRREARLLAKIERRAVSAARHVWCLAEEDRSGFGVDITERSSVVPLLLPDADAGPALDPSPDFHHDVGLIGTWTWQPNFVGLKWFLDDVAPRLPKDIRVAVAGRLPPGFSTAAEVSLLGRVEDARAFVATSRVMALTSRIGTGVQLKTIETFQNGKPAVATRSSVRGFESLPANCLVADDPESYAHALIKLVRDVQAERAGPVDPAPFILAQRSGLQRAIREGVLALRS